MAVKETGPKVFVEGEYFDPNEIIEADTLDSNTVQEIRKNVGKRYSMSSRVSDREIPLDNMTETSDVVAFMRMACADIKDSPRHKPLHLSPNTSRKSSPAKQHSPHVLKRFNFPPLADNPSVQNVSKAVTPVFQNFEIYFV